MSFYAPAAIVWGPLDGLFSFPLSGLWAVVNNAGVSTFGEVEFTSVDAYKQVSEVNLWGTIRVTKAVLPLIRRAKGQLRLVKQCPHLRLQFWECSLFRRVQTHID